MINRINRIKNLIVSPKNEWGVIEGENMPHVKLFTSYVLPLSLITVVAAFIGYGVIGYSVFGFRVHSIELGVKQAIVQWITMVAGIYVSALGIYFLAKPFGANKNFDKSFSLVAHAYTPFLLSGIFYILPSISWLAFLLGIYSLYLLYLGLQPMMKAPAEKNTGYFFASLGTIVAAAMTIWLMVWIFMLIVGAIFYGSALRYGF
jgi:hypothetical protein